MWNKWGHALSLDRDRVLEPSVPECAPASDGCSLDWLGMARPAEALASLVQCERLWTLCPELRELIDYVVGQGFDGDANPHGLLEDEREMLALYTSAPPLYTDRVGARPFTRC